MKAFTLFNLIAQPALILLMFLRSNLMMGDIKQLLFAIFCTLQVTHFIVRILPQHRKKTKLSGSEEIMIIYLLAIILFGFIGMLLEDGLFIILLLLLVSGIISSITNYLSLISYFHFIKTKK
jgi:hypothetical protein